jgi:hypothetical protein
MRVVKRVVDFSPSFFNEVIVALRHGDSRPYLFILKVTAPAGPSPALAND